MGWIVRLFVLMQLVHVVFCWGKHGHYAVCKIAEGYLSKDAMATVKELLPDYANGELASVCSWPDDIKWYYRWYWTSPLHYVDTPSFKCNYKYGRDCYDSAGRRNNCVTGAIFNYTKQLFSAYQGYNPNLKCKYCSYIYTYMYWFIIYSSSVCDRQFDRGTHFLSSLYGRCSSGDLGGTILKVRWYRKKTNLHHVWDTLIIDTAVKTFYGSDLSTMVRAIQRNITDAWSSDIASWKSCRHHDRVCPNLYAAESVRLACNFAYKNATPGSILEDDYFLSRLPVVEKRLAQGGIRLAAVLNQLLNFEVKIGQSL
ncbi:endonuclease 4 isoform X1 [Gossypium raimondii]|uniref:endonuclease 4 isoform X1 n=1 Tax=Gossypium raimondii TaxID=29730 RepID=UPI00227AFB40|nr:endonuclease 4 isoform X1 [Gossypium raimondii]